MDEAAHRRRFEITLGVKGDCGSGPPVLSGPFCHGAPASRFRYLSWKRQGIHRVAAHETGTAGQKPP